MFEKLCVGPRVKGAKEADLELTYLLSWLNKTDALEWIYLLCIMKQEATSFQEKLLGELHDEKRMEVFISRVRGGTRHLLEWAETRW